MGLICANGSVLVDEPDELIKEGLVLAAGCRRWGCQVCSRLKAHELRIRLMKALSTYYEQEVDWLREQGRNPTDAWHPFKFLTLTVDPKKFISTDRYERGDWQARPDEARLAFQRLKRAWNRLHSWLRYRWVRTQEGHVGPRAKWEGAARTFPFLWVLEFTGNGWPHLHLIVLWREQIPWPDLETIRRLWDKYGIGRSVDLQNKNWQWEGPQALGIYLAKYLTKQWPVSPKHDRLRRWSSSRSFLLPKERRQYWDAGWSYASVETHRIERLNAGAKIRDFSTGFRYWLEGQLGAVIHGRDSPGNFFAGLPQGPYRYPGLSFYRRIKLGDPRADP